MITEKEWTTLAKIDIEKYAGIYIGGGNTLYLLKKLKENKFWTQIKKAMEKNIPIYGGSAGAIIFSKSIITSTHFDKNWVELRDLEGMNVLKGNHLFCHYSAEKEAKIKEIISGEKIASSIALSGSTGIYVTAKGAKVIGKEPAWLFDKKGNKKELRVGTLIK